MVQGSGFKARKERNKDQGKGTGSKLGFECEKKRHKKAGTRYNAQGTRQKAQGTKYKVGTGYRVQGTRYKVQGTRYKGLKSQV